MNQNQLEQFSIETSISILFFYLVDVDLSDKTILTEQEKLFMSDIEDGNYEDASGTLDAIEDIATRVDSLKIPGLSFAEWTDQFQQKAA